MGPEIMEIFAIGGMVLAVLGTALFPLNVWLRNRERQRDRELLLRLTQEKLDVLRSAIASGYDEQQLLALDARLERLLGQQQFTELIRDIGTYTDEQGKPVVDTPLASQDLSTGAANPARSKLSN